MLSFVHSQLIEHLYSTCMHVRFSLVLKKERWDVDRNCPFVEMVLSKLEKIVIVD